MKIYLSLPITGQDEPTQRRRAKNWQSILQKKGHTVINPFDISDALNQFHKDACSPRPTWEEYMQADIREIMLCNLVIILEGWENSKGCILEAELATQVFNIKVEFERFIVL